MGLVRIVDFCGCKSTCSVEEGGRVVDEFFLHNYRIPNSRSAGLGGPVGGRTAAEER